MLSATSIKMYQSCNWSFFLKYRLGWRPEKKKDVFRIGSHWAKCQEIASLKPGELCPECTKNRFIDVDCYLCEGSGTVGTEALETVMRYLEFSYVDMPSHFNAEQWVTEKLVLLNAFCAYKWKYPQDEYEVIASEVPFSLPIIDPTTGKKLPKCRLDGVIDQIWRHIETGRIVIGEQKSTSSSLEDGGYWDILKVSGQVQTYSYALWMLWVGGALKQYGLEPSDAVIVQPVYDVWKKPTIKVKKLSMADSKKFVATGVYYEKKFEVEEQLPAWPDVGVDDPEKQRYFRVNDTPAIVESGAKEGTFTIRETPEMYAERLLTDITERPDFYFARKEIPVDEIALQVFAENCVKLVKTIQYIEKENLWIRDSRGCKNPGKCDFYDACHDNKDFPCDVEAAPEGFRTTLDSESVVKRELERKWRKNECLQ